MTLAMWWSEVLVSKEIEVEWNKVNKNRYEKLGYIFTGYGTKLLIKTFDIPNSTGIVVDLMCDRCERQFTRKSKDFIGSKKRQKKEDKHLDYCKECSLLNNKDNLNEMDRKRREPMSIKKIIQRGL